MALLVAQVKQVLDGKPVDVKLAVPRSEPSAALPPAPPALSCKIFVGGLSHSTEDLEFRRHFERFGEVTDSVVMKDPVSRRPRGFGFVTFAYPQAAREACITVVPHLIRGKQVEVKPAVPGTPPTPATASSLPPQLVASITDVPPFLPREGAQLLPAQLEMRPSVSVGDQRVGEDQLALLAASMERVRFGAAEQPRRQTELGAQPPVGGFPLAPSPLHTYAPHGVQAVGARGSARLYDPLALGAAATPRVGALASHVFPATGSLRSAREASVHPGPDRPARDAAVPQCPALPTPATMDMFIAPLGLVPRAAAPAAATPFGFLP